MHRTPDFAPLLTTAPLVGSSAEPVRIAGERNREIPDDFRKGADVDGIVEDHEGHGCENGETRLRFHGAMDRFLRGDFERKDPS